MEMNVSIKSCLFDIRIKGNNKPIERARFGYFLENMNYVMQMSIIKPLPDSLYEYVIKEFIKCKANLF